MFHALIKAFVAIARGAQFARRGEQFMSVRLTDPRLHPSLTSQVQGVDLLCVPWTGTRNAPSIQRRADAMPALSIPPYLQQCVLCTLRQVVPLKRKKSHACPLGSSVATSHHMPTSDSLYMTQVRDYQRQSPDSNSQPASVNRCEPPPLSDLRTVALFRMLLTHTESSNISRACVGLLGLPRCRISPDDDP